MTDIYSGGDDGADGGGATNVRPATRTPYRGPRVRSRSTGEVYYWTGNTYVPANSPERLTPQERTARQSAIDNAQRLQTALPDLNRYEELNRSVPTGSVTQRLGQWAGDLPQILSIDDPTTSLNEPAGMDEMRAITDRLTPRQRVPGSGATSDFEGRMFRGALPNRGRSGPANSAIIGGLRNEARDAQEYSEFLDWYWPQAGSLTGAQEHYGEYRAARARNPNLTWRQYFTRPQAQPEQPRQGGGARPAPARAAPRGPGGGGAAQEQWVRDPRTGQIVPAGRR
jgi:hypothetical protein